MEKLQLEVSLQTQEAAANAQALMAALANVKLHAEQAGQAIDAAEHQISAMGGAAQAAGAQVGQLATTSGTAANAAQNLTAVQNNLTVSIDQSSTVINKTTNVLKQTAAATEHVSGMTTNLIERVGSLALSYVGLNTALSMMRELEEQTRRVVAARNDLAGEDINLARGVRNFMVNKGVEGPEAEARAQRTVLGMTQRTGATPQQVVAGMASGQAAGFDVDFDKGNGDVEELIAYAHRANINSPEAFDSLARGMASRRVRDQSAGRKFDAAQFLAEFKAAFAQSAVQNVDEFAANYIRATQYRGERGGSDEQGASLYSAAIAVMKDPAIASTSVEILSRLAEGRSEKSVRMLGGVAQRYGFIQGASDERVNQITAAELGRQKVEGYAPEAGETKLVDEVERDERRLRDMQDGKEKAERAYQLQQDRFAADGQKLDAEGRRARRPDQKAQVQRNKDLLAEQVAKADADRQSAIRETQDKIDEASRKVDADKEKLRGMVDLRLKQQQFEKLDQDTKEKVLLKLMQESGDSPEVRDWLLESGVVDARSLSKLVSIAGATGQQKMGETREAFRSADAGQFRQDRQVYVATKAGASDLTAAEDQAKRIGSVQSGGAFASDLAQQADSDIKVLRSQGAGDVGFFSYVGQHFNTHDATNQNAINEEGLRAKRMATLLTERVNQFLTTMDRAQYERHRAEIDAWVNLWWRDKHRGYARVIQLADIPFQGPAAVRLVQDRATEWGAIEVRVQADAIGHGERIPNHLPGSGPSTPAPAARPATRPAAADPGSSGSSAGPLSDAAGNPFTFADADPSSPAIGEALAGAGAGGRTGPANLDEQVEAAESEARDAQETWHNAYLAAAERPRDAELMYRRIDAMGRVRQTGARLAALQRHRDRLVSSDAYHGQALPAVNFDDDEQHGAPAASAAPQPPRATTQASPPPARPAHKPIRYHDAETGELRTYAPPTSGAPISYRMDEHDEVREWHPPAHQGDAGHAPVSVNHYHVQHIGNYWSGGAGGDFDMPGRLEGLT